MDSILEQSADCFEYIVVDGKSSDKTAELLEIYREKFKSSRIPFCTISERDKGTYDAMNKGADMAHGEWIIYMNAGDTFYNPDTLKVFFEQDIPKEITYCYGDTYKQWDFGGSIETPTEGSKDNPYMPFCHQSVFVRSESMRRYRFDLKYRIVADYDLFYRMKNAGEKSLYLPLVVSRYNRQYGLSAQNPLQLRREGLLIHGIDKTWQYPFRLAWIYARYGWINWAKTHLPTALINAWMKHRHCRRVD